MSTAAGAAAVAPAPDSGALTGRKRRAKPDPDADADADDEPSVVAAAAAATAADAAAAGSGSDDDGDDGSSAKPPKRKRVRIRPSKKVLDRDGNAVHVPRTTVACAPCARLKTRCDGHFPCARCVKHGRSADCKPRELQRVTTSSVIATAAAALAAAASSGAAGPHQFPVPLFFGPYAPVPAAGVGAAAATFMATHPLSAGFAYSQRVWPGAPTPTPTPAPTTMPLPPTPAAAAAAAISAAGPGPVPGVPLVSAETQAHALATLVALAQGRLPPPAPLLTVQALAPTPLLPPLPPLTAALPPAASASASAPAASAAVPFTPAALVQTPHAVASASAAALVHTPHAVASTSSTAVTAPATPAALFLVPDTPVQVAAAPAVAPAVADPSASLSLSLEQILGSSVLDEHDFFDAQLEAAATASVAAGVAEADSAAVATLPAPAASAPTPAPMPASTLVVTDSAVAQRLPAVQQLVARVRETVAHAAPSGPATATDSGGGNDLKARRVPDAIVQSAIRDTVDCNHLALMARWLGPQFLASIVVTVDSWMQRMLTPKGYALLQSHRTSVVPQAIVDLSHRIVPKFDFQWIAADPPEAALPALPALTATPAPAPPSPSPSPSPSAVAAADGYDGWYFLPMAIIRHEHSDPHRLQHFAAMHAHMHPSPQHSGDAARPVVRVSVNRAAQELFGYDTAAYVALYDGVPAAFKLLHPAEWRAHMEFETRAIGLFRSWTLADAAAATAAATAAPAPSGATTSAAASLPPPAPAHLANALLLASPTAESMAIPAPADVDVAQLLMGADPAVVAALTSTGLKLPLPPGGAAQLLLEHYNPDNDHICASCARARHPANGAPTQAAAAAAAATTTAQAHASHAQSAQAHRNTILSGTSDPRDAFCDTGGRQVYTTVAKRRVAVRFSRPGVAEQTSLVHVLHRDGHSVPTLLTSKLSMTYSPGERVFRTRMEMVFVPILEGLLQSA